MSLAPGRGGTGLVYHISERRTRRTEKPTREATKRYNDGGDDQIRECPTTLEGELENCVAARYTSAGFNKWASYELRMSSFTLLTIFCLLLTWSESCART